MYLSIGGVRYPCEDYRADERSARFYGVTGRTAPIAGVVTLCDEAGAILAKQDTADYLRSYLDGSTVVLTNEPEPEPEQVMPHAPTEAEQIAEKKKQLAATDYRIIKCSEFALAGVKPAPYDVAALHGERQALRDQINALEAQK